MKYIDIQIVQKGMKSLEVDKIPTTRHNLVKLVKDKVGISLGDYYISDEYGKNVTDTLLKKYRDENRDLFLYGE